MTLKHIGGWYVDEHGKKWGSPEEYEYFRKRAPALPTVEQRGFAGRDETVERHPAFGQIAASHVTSTGMNLYGSNFQHRGCVTIRLSHSEMHRGLSHDRPSAGNRIVEVSLSEAQWATFISSLNMGDGVCCTIESISRSEGGVLPQIASRPDRRAQFKAEAAKDLADAEARIDEALALVEAGKMTKGALRSLPIQAKNHMTGAVDFVAKQFGEHVESTIQNAKIEIEAYAQQTVQRAGVKALTEHGDLPRLVESETRTDKE